MSEQRFYVLEGSPGYPISPSTTNAGSQEPVAEVLVLDRSNCHKVVWSSATAVVEIQRRYFKREASGRRRPNIYRDRVTTRKWTPAARRAYAAELAERLNEEVA